MSVAPRRPTRWFSERGAPLRQVVSPLEWFRFLTERFLLVPTAAFLPVGAGLAVAEALGFIEWLSHSRASRSARAEMVAATGLTGSALTRALRRRLSASKRDLVWAERMRRGRERVSQWRVINVDDGPMRDLVAAGQPIMLCGGHFDAASRALRFTVTPADEMHVSGDIPRWKLSPHQLRRRLEERAHWGKEEGLFGLPNTTADIRSRRAIMADIWGRGTVWSEVTPARSPQDLILAALRTPGHAAMIQSDAIWEKPGAHRRPFAGMSERGFAVGAARLTRLAQCPLVPFVAVTGPDRRSVIIEWGTPIPPPLVDDKAADVRVMDEALDFIERGVGRYPYQYFHPIGTERRWDAPTERWVPR
jgi:hypothetical protein